MRSVWKYALANTLGTDIIEMPLGAKILRIGQVTNELFIWAIVDPTQTETEARTFVKVFTGEEFFGEHLASLGTVLLHAGSIVVHVFEQEQA
jgi:uncharacterized protein (AIM24 family)